MSHSITSGIFTIETSDVLRNLIRIQYTFLKSRLNNNVDNFALIYVQRFMTKSLALTKKKKS